jgi:hypothetical protein
MLFASRILNAVLGEIVVEACRNSCRLLRGRKANALVHMSELVDCGICDSSVAFLRYDGRHRFHSMLPTATVGIQMVLALDHFYFQAGPSRLACLAFSRPSSQGHSCSKRSNAATVMLVHFSDRDALTGVTSTLQYLQCIRPLCFRISYHHHYLG